MDLTLYTNPMSRGRIAHWMLEEVGQPYEVTYLSYGGSIKSDAYRAINPLGKVPALRHRDAIVTETSAICAYLADAFPDAGLAPSPTSPARAAYLRWLFFAAGPLEAAIVNASLGVTVSDEHKAMVGYGSIAEIITALESAVRGRTFIAGDHFSAADLYVASVIDFGMHFGVIERTPELMRYWEGIDARPAAARARAVDDAAIPTPA